MSTDQASVYQPLETAQFVSTAVIIYIVPVVAINVIFRVLRGTGRLDESHRKMLSKALDLLVFSQLLLLSAGFDAFTSLSCDPDVLLSKLGGDWVTGSNGCGEMVLAERDVVDCGWAGVLRSITTVMTIFSGALMLLVTWATSSGLEDGAALKTEHVFTINVMLVINTLLWSAHYWFSLYSLGPCRVAEGAVATGAVYIILSYSLIILERFLRVEPGRSKAAVALESRV